MKFVGGIQNFKIENNSITIKLPYYHRVATGLISGAEVYLFPKILKVKNAAGLETEVKEIIISPFPPCDWLTIYEMELVMEDKPGMINLITSILAENDINIHIQESLINNDEQNFSVSLIVDIKKFQNKFKHDDSNSMQSVLEKAFVDKDISLEKFQPCKQLYNNSQDFQKSSKKTNYIDNIKLVDYYETHYQPVEIIDKQLRIGKRLIEDLYPSSTRSKELQGTIFSDTSEKLIIVRFFNVDQLVVYFDIQHENRLGAISQYSSLIKKISKSYNVISCYNRIENAKKTAYWYVLLDVSHDISVLHNLFYELRSASYTMSLNVHSYSRSIEAMNLPELFPEFPSIAHVTIENNQKAKDTENATKFQEAINQINILKEDLLSRELEFKATKRQFWIVLFFIILIITFLLTKTVTYSDVNKVWLIVVAIASGLLTLIHALVVYFEAPKMYDRIFKKRNKETK